MPVPQARHIDNADGKLAPVVLASDGNKISQRGLTRIEPESDGDNGIYT